MALFRGIQEYIALNANNNTLVFDHETVVFYLVDVHGFLTIVSNVKCKPLCGATYRHFDKYTGDLKDKYPNFEVGLKCIIMVF